VDQIVRGTESRRGRRNFESPAGSVGSVTARMGFDKADG
jgi:hypothetical protein